MKQELIIQQNKAFGVAYAEKKGLIFVLARDHVNIYDLKTRKPVAAFPTEQAPTDICFDDENENIFMLDSLGDLYLYKMDKVLAGDGRFEKEMAAFELMNTCHSLHYFKDGWVLGLGTTGDYIVNIFEEKKFGVYDYSMEEYVFKKKNNNRYYDRKTGLITAVIEGREFGAEQKEFTDPRTDITIPIEVVTVKNDIFHSTFAEDFIIVTEKKSRGLLKQNANVMVKRRKMELRGILPDKKYLKCLEQNNIYQTAVINDRLLLLNTFKSLMLIDYKNNKLRLDLVDNVFGQFSVIDEHSVLFTVEKQGVVLLSDI